MQALPRSGYHHHHTLCRVRGEGDQDSPANHRRDHTCRFVVEEVAGWVRGISRATFNALCFIYRYYTVSCK